MIFLAWGRFCRWIPCSRDFKAQYCSRKIHWRIRRPNTRKWSIRPSEFHKASEFPSSLNFLARRKHISQPFRSPRVHRLEHELDAFLHTVRVQEPRWCHTNYNPFSDQRQTHGQSITKIPFPSAESPWWHDFRVRHGSTEGVPSQVGLFWKLHILKKSFVKTNRLKMWKQKQFLLQYVGNRIFYVHITGKNRCMNMKMKNEITKARNILDEEQRTPLSLVAYCRFLFIKGSSHWYTQKALKLSLDQLRMSLWVLEQGIRKNICQEKIQKQKNPFWLID